MFIKITKKLFDRYVIKYVESFTIKAFKIVNFCNMQEFSIEKCDNSYIKSGIILIDGVTFRSEERR